MESLSQALSQSLTSNGVSSGHLSSLDEYHSPRSPFQDTYDRARKIESQDDRRQRILKDLRKEKRDEAVWKKYAAGFATEPDQSLVENSASRHESMCEDCEDTKPTSGAGSSPTKPGKSLPRLTLSEWLYEIPSDFDDNWLMIPCPLGKRCQLVTNRGRTSVHSKTGLAMMSGTSSLPGGNTTKRQSTSFTVVDCILDPATNKFFVLDVLFWNGTSLLDSTFEFRMFWIRSRLRELDSLTLTVDHQTYDLVELATFSCTLEILEPYFSSEEAADPCIDGFLFYHKNGSYVTGTTPLVCWLKPFMVQEVLRIPVRADVLSTKPSDYVNLQTFVKGLEAKKPPRSDKTPRKAKARNMNVNLKEENADLQE
ncbi:hypothetical protein RvY_09667 [Ramazzottius varieornatus]|uniref:Snurportin-1 n=1 Tax=Ramazzottius varieornatus TaxID=947166 RepID=A0A1D1VA74_RAMVA|nr:hypothetical protein RvY_09667 [Ramazzottius varieornatus]